MTSKSIKCIRFISKTRSGFPVHAKALKALVKHAGFNNTKEAEDADSWITVEEIQQIIGYDYGTTSSNIRDFRKPPAGRFTILRIAFAFSRFFILSKDGARRHCIS